MAKLLFFSFFFIFLIASCAKRITVSSWEYQFAIKEGDSVMCFTNIKQDTLPDCYNPLNNSDSLDNIRFQYIREIHPTYFTVSEIGGYHYDTITRKERRQKRLENRTVYKKRWKYYEESYYELKDSFPPIEHFIYKRPVFSKPIEIEMDSVCEILKYQYYTECDNLFKRLWKDLYFGTRLKPPFKLYRYDSDKCRFKIKGVRRS